MAGERTIRIKFDGSAEGFARAARKAGRELDAFERKAATTTAKSGAKAGLSLMESIGDAIRDNLPKLLTKAGPLAAPLLMIGIPLMVELGATLGGALAASISAAIAGGVILAGVLLAVRDPKIKAAFAGLGQEIMAELTYASSVFLAPLRRTVGKIRDTFHQLDFEGLFASAARYVDPLVDGLLGLARTVMPAIRRAVDAAAPVIAVISRHLPKIGQAISDALDSITGDSGAAAGALDHLLTMLEGIIRFGGSVIGTLVEIFRWVVNIADGANKVANALYGWNPIFKGQIDKNREQIDQVKAAMDGAKTAGDKWKGGTFELIGAQSQLETDVEAATQAARRQAEAVAGLYGAETNVAQATRDFAAAIKENGKQHGINSEKGIANRRAIENLGSAYRTEIKAAEDSGASAAEVARRQNDARTALYNAARQMGYSETAARDLADGLLGIPKTVSPKVNVQITQASANVFKIKREIEGIKGKTVTITTVRRDKAGDHVSGSGGSGTLTRRWGGIDYAMARGGALAAHFTRSPTVLFGERSTGGEAFIPRLGNLARSRRIAETVVRDWLGGDVLWGRRNTAPAGASSSSGGGSTVVENRVYLDGQPFYAMTATTVRSAQRREAWRAKVGVR